MSTSGAGLARVLSWNFQQRYPELDGFVGERVTEQAIGYPVGLSSTSAAQLSFVSSELVEAFDGDCCVVRSSEIGQGFSEKPSVRADVVALSSSEFSEFESCFASMSVLVSILLQFGAAVFVSDLSQGDCSSKVELLQNPASPLVHHGDSNAIGVLIYADHILRDLWGWLVLPEQHEETVATGHQDACSSPIITDMFQQPPVGSVTLDGQTETFTVAAYTQNWVPMPCTSPREQALIESYRWPLNPVGNLASLPSVPLRFLNKLARYLPVSVWVDDVVQFPVCAWFGVSYGLKRGGCGLLEGCIGFTELMLFRVRQRSKVELQCLLRRYLPQGRNVAPTTLSGELRETALAIPITSQFVGFLAVIL
jgi:hypothetical protein